MKYLERRQHIEKLRVDFKEIKKRVLKKFPHAKLKSDKNKKYFIVDEAGFRILRDLDMYPNSDSVFDAWLSVDLVARTMQIIDSNNKRFSDDKIFRKIKD